MPEAAKSKALTVDFVKPAKDPGKYHDGKGTGLFLLVKPTGGRFWVQRQAVNFENRQPNVNKEGVQETRGYSVMLNATVNAE